MNLNHFKTDHVGYLTGDIKSTAQTFATLGYTLGEIYDDDIQKTKIAFLTKEGDIKIELVEPYEDNKTMQKMLRKNGVMPYHMCFVCQDIDRLYDELLENDWTPLFRPVEAIAFGNRKICYFFKSEIGFIEFLNEK